MTRPNRAPRSADGVRPTRVLFASPYCLLDTANGAAVQMRALLRALAREGYACAALTGAVFTGAYARDCVRVRRVRAAASGGSFVTLDGAVEHTITASADGPYHSGTYLERLGAKLRTYAPDLLMVLGGRGHENAIVRLAVEFGIPTMLHHTTVTLPPDADVARAATMVVVPSEFAARQFRRSSGVEARVLYPFRLGTAHVTHRRLARFVTFVNPVPEKGLGLVYRVAQEARRRLPEAEFLVIEGRWTRASVRASGADLAAMPNVVFMRNQADVRRIYARTKVLLMPSLWEEAFGMVSVEAQANGIPVIASAVGGIPEAMNGGGSLIRAPSRCVRDHSQVPSAREVAPWLDRLETLLRNPAAYRAARRSARLAAARFSSVSVTPKAVELVRDCVARAPRPDGRVRPATPS